ncbi:MAG: TraR/DksA family transcriptional regulator [Pseudomonadales bacterium]|nr:TraR/DksA family transcriptional regulator [Pseudomonadales bacterium]
MTKPPFASMEAKIAAELTSRRDSLMERISKVTTDIRKEHSADWSEQAQERQNDEVLEAIGNESRNELNQINKALERIENGNYTICSRCGGDISIARLQAVPYTILCIQCADR